LRLGFQKYAVGASAFVRIFPAHFAVAGLAGQALIRNRKTSYTARTLYEMRAKIGWKIVQSGFVAD
jgi:hypothetical protein